MMKNKKPLTILKYPDPKLKEKCGIVREESNWEEVRQLIDLMHYTMKFFKGVGLAAPQVGVSLRIFVMNCTGDSKDAVTMINPEILEFDGKKDSYEGCLSFPQLGTTLTRAEKVKVKWLDEFAEEHQREFDGLESVCVQHEIDHLNGILFIDRMSNMKKQMIIKKMKKRGFI